VYGGNTRFSYRMAPLNVKGLAPTNTFDTEYENVDLASIGDLFKMDGIRLAGHASGRNLLQWPLRRYREHTGKGEVRITPPGEMLLMTREMPRDRIAVRAAHGQDAGPFSPLTPTEPVPIGGEITYAFGPEWIDLAPSRLATESTLVEFEGRTKYGDESKIPFHVSSADWQESDRVFAGILTAFGSRTRAISIGGYGSFDGVMTETFQRPRIEGDFNGEQIRAFDVVWGAVRGHTVIENSYATVKDVKITSADSVITTDGRYSLGFPRRDGGEEINARIQISRRPVADLRHGFALDEYDIEGLFNGEFQIVGKYQTPEGLGRMEIVDGVLYGEPVDGASASVELEGKGVRLSSITISKGGGRGTGNAYIGWNSTYAFNFDARGIPAESIAASKTIGLPISALLDFRADGSGSFDAPRFDVKGTLRDVFIADEGIGQLVGDVGVKDQLMTLRLEAASPRLAVSVVGRIAMNPERDADVTLTVNDTSLDPYVRLFLPQLSPYTTAVTSGSIRIVGELQDIDHLLVDVTVDKLDMRLFDYALRNARPMRVALDRHSVRIDDMRLEGQDTQIDISGLANLHDETINIRASGDANLAVLQGFIPNIRSSGTANLSATLEGPLMDPAVGGTFEVKDGRVRSFALPHALENINGPLRFDSRGVTLDGLTARLGGGDVQFGGRIDKQGYLPGRLDVTMTGSDMRLRFPEGMRSLVDATLALQGTVANAVLSGDVNVKDAVYTQPFDPGGSLFDFGDDETLVPATARQDQLPVRLDVHIIAPSTLQVQNRTVRLVASADLQLRGTLDRPVVFGRAEIQEGEALFEGKRYVIRRGTIDFNNPNRIEPFVDIEAETRIRVPQETYRVTLRATGPIAQPNVSFDSDPPLSQVEVLALVFSDVAPGGNAELRAYDTGNTPQEQLVRERLARALTGRVSSEVSRVVEQAFAVDAFQITPSLADPNSQSSRLDPGMRVTVLKRLSDRLYLTYSRSMSSTTRDQIILLEFDQTDRLSWILSRNEDGTYALDWRVRKTF
jgi:translocation and assembly module TamB